MFLKEFDGIIISGEELAVRQKELAEKGGFNSPESQTPWQEIFRNTVGQLEDGACIRSRGFYMDIAGKKGIPRNNH